MQLMLNLKQMQLKRNLYRWRSPCQTPLRVGGAELVLLDERGAGGAVRLHCDLVELAARRVMRKADPHHVL
jgi:hypothetical protein